MHPLLVGRSFFQILDPKTGGYWTAGTNIFNHYLFALGLALVHWMTLVPT